MCSSRCAAQSPPPTAVRQGDSYVVSGQKVWASNAQYARYGVLLARTGDAAAIAEIFTEVVIAPEVGEVMTTIMPGWQM